MQKTKYFQILMKISIEIFLEPNRNFTSKTKSKDITKSIMIRII